MLHFGVLYIIERRLGPPNVAAPGVIYPFPYTSRSGRAWIEAVGSRQLRHLRCIQVACVALRGNSA